PTSKSAFSNLTCRLPRMTTVYSSNSGVCPGSDQPDGLFMRAMLTSVVPEFTRPMNSSISFGGLPAASIRVGFWIYVAIAIFGLFLGPRAFVQKRRRHRPSASLYRPHDPPRYGWKEAIERENNP